MAPEWEPVVLCTGSQTVLSGCRTDEPPAENETLCFFQTSKQVNKTGRGEECERDGKKAVGR